MNVVVTRKTKPEELDWVNLKYTEVDFKPSSLNNLIIVAELHGVKAGLGRLVKIDVNNFELGGIYVFPEFRRLGVADKIVSKLYESSLQEKTIWCLPFSNLLPFYSKFGFKEIDSEVLVPSEIQDKYNWCNTNYEKEVLLLVKR